MRYAMALSQRVLAEIIGTFWLVFAGCGSAVISAAYPGLGIGFVGVALAFGLSVLTAAYAIGHISGAHLNPAITFGLVAARKFPRGELLPYVIGQLVGAILASGLLYLVASGAADFRLDQGFAANGYGDHSPAGYSLSSALVTEFFLTFMFVFIILNVTSNEALKGFAPLAIGLTLTVIHLISIPVTNTSVNPARSTGPALIAGGWALQQLWLFWVSPVLGGVAAGVSYRSLRWERLREAEPAGTERPLKRAASA